MPPADATYAQDRCIWGCGRPADSREDVLAEWIREYLGAKVSHKKDWHLRDLTPIDSRVPTTRNPRPGRRRFLRVRTDKVVCAACNNEWMSELQKQAKPALTAMFDGKPVTIGPTIHSVLVTWACMTAICNHYATELEVDKSRRDYLYKNQAPAPYTQVVAAHIEAPTLDTMHASGGWRDTLGHVPRGYVDLFGIRHAAFLIVQGSIPSAVQPVLTGVAGAILRPVPDLSQSIHWPVGAVTTESFGQLYENIIATMHELGKP